MSTHHLFHLKWKHKINTSIISHNILLISKIYEKHLNSVDSLQIDNSVNLTNHTDKFIPKLNGSRYAVRSTFRISNTDILKLAYFAYFLSMLKYGIILGGNSSNSIKILIFKRKLLD
jgi:hypothetical protein